MIGSSPVLNHVRRAIAQVAPTDATVLIHGETGTGKELVARAIHEQSPRNKHALVPVSSVALAPGLLTSELFGHEAGAFTGADKRRIGRFEKAQNGTLFLDEIGEMPIESQSILLRVLQERVIERVGGSALPVDFRVISATNRNLEAEVHAGRFRQDLFFRLNVFPIALPPLRERASDIAELATHFLKLYAEKYSRTVRSISKSTLKQLSCYDWPGNIRELQNTIERAVIVSEGDELAFNPGWLAGTSVIDSPKTWAAQERQRILDALEAANGRVYGPGGAAHRLGLNPTTLYGKMKKHGINRSDAS
jgi:formate hydrogenlyase transcriptional activator